MNANGRIISHRLELFCIILEGSIFVQKPLNLSPTCLKWQPDVLTKVEGLKITRIFMTLFLLCHPLLSETKSRSLDF
jgi:hypothetical protein